MFCSLLKSFFSPHKYFIFKGLFIYSNSYFSDKGLVSIQGKSHQVIVQGVHELYDLEETAVAWKEDEKRTNRLVLIGMSNFMSFSVASRSFFFQQQSSYLYSEKQPARVTAIMMFCVTFSPSSICENSLCLLTAAESSCAVLCS